MKIKILMAGLISSLSLVSAASADVQSSQIPANCKERFAKIEDLHDGVRSDRTVLKCRFHGLYSNQKFPGHLTNPITGTTWVQSPPDLATSTPDSDTANRSQEICLSVQNGSIEALEDATTLQFVDHKSKAEERLGNRLTFNSATVEKLSIEKESFSLQRSQKKFDSYSGSIPCPADPSQLKENERIVRYNGSNYCWHDFTKRRGTSRNVVRLDKEGDAFRLLIADMYPQMIPTNTLYRCEIEN